MTPHPSNFAITKDLFILSGHLERDLTLNPAMATKLGLLFAKLEDHAERDAWTAEVLACF